VTTPLFVDGIGKEAWRVMLHRASNTLRPTDEFESDLFDGRKKRNTRAELTAPATGAFAQFFSQLQTFLETRAKSGECWEITLIGHSMGAIIINDALQLFPQLPVSNIVFMAPACSIGEAEEAIVPYLEKNKKAKFFILTLHPLAEAEEVVAYDLPSRGSLLEWIDQWFQSPDHPLDRRLGKWNNALDALHVFSSVRGRVTLKGFGVQGNSIPQTHGDFSDCPFWRPTFWDVECPDAYSPADGDAARRKAASAAEPIDGGS
jgi:pimeloyl-ACP methyl ester carboxylesterase